MKRASKIFPEITSLCYVVPSFCDECQTSHVAIITLKCDTTTLLFHQVHLSALPSAVYRQVNEPKLRNTDEYCTLKEALHITPSSFVARIKGEGHKLNQSASIRTG